MARPKQKPHRRKFNEDKFSDGIGSKVLRSVSIAHGLDCRYISIEFEDKTELTITLETLATGTLELSNWTTGDQELIKKVGLIPDEARLWRPKL